MTTFTEEKTSSTKEHQNGHNTSFQHDQAAKAYILALKAHEKPASIPDVGKWWQCCKNLSDAYDRNPDAIDLVIKSFIASRLYKGMDTLLSDASSSGHAAYQEFPP